MCIGFTANVVQQVKQEQPAPGPPPEPKPGSPEDTYWPGADNKRNKRVQADAKVTGRARINKVLIKKTRP